MGRAEAFPGRMSSAVLLTLLVAVIASAAAFVVLYAAYAPPALDAAGRSAELTTVGDGMSAEERRELTRQMLKARRENPETPAQVRPVPSSPSAPRTTADAIMAGAADAKAHPDRPPPQGSPARSAARNKPDTAGQVAALAPSAAAAINNASKIAPGGVPNSVAGAGQVVPSGPAAPGVTLPPVVVSTPAVKPPPGTVPGEANAALEPGASGDPATAAPVGRSFAANVFSTISVFAGSAANATGNTVNWVIKLPGKAISAGGKLLGGNSGAGNSPATQSSQSPPPKGS